MNRKCVEPFTYSNSILLTLIISILLPGWLYPAPRPRWGLPSPTLPWNVHERERGGGYFDDDILTCSALSDDEVSDENDDTNDGDAGEHGQHDRRNLECVHSLFHRVVCANNSFTIVNKRL